MVHMDQLPVFLQLSHSPCLVVGGGVVAERKVRLLMRASAAVTVVAHDLTDELARLRDADRIVHHAGVFTDRLLAHITQFVSNALIIANADINTAIRRCQ